ncbi:ParB/RepB/Spo0J family partition protein [Ruminococcaceae bacterium OttesenSCG-928-O06]|nr:ParB/RepB/Spo0J family partition protein [Ruminococcaceae bacterium OttesenSCG-928-O06]
MATKKGGLGRGLDSLFADTGSGSAAPTGEVNTIPLREIEPDKDQPRKTFEGQALAELAQSIEEHGVLQPILVRPNPAGGYKIVAGERRWRAARQAGLREIPAMVREISDAEALELALIENLQREDLDPVEEALGYRHLMERCGYTQEQAAQRLSRSRSAVANSLRLLALPEDVLALLKIGALSAGHAKAILSIPSAARQSEAAALMVQDKLNVRAAEALCKKLQKQPQKSRKNARPTIAAEVEISLREALGTEVKVEYQDGKGSLKVGFYSEEQLRAFANLLGAYTQEGEA